MFVTPRDEITKKGLIISLSILFIGIIFIVFSSFMLTLLKASPMFLIITIIIMITLIIIIMFLYNKYFKRE